MRLNIQGLRSSDGLTLTTMCQDVVRQPMVEIHPATVCDLLELSLSTGLQEQLRQDLERFAPQMLREIGDLPDSLFPKFLQDLVLVLPEHIPASVKLAVIERVDQGKDDPKTQEAWTTTKAHFESSEPEAIVLGDATTHVAVGVFDVPDSHKIPAERAHKPRSRKKAADAADTDEEGAAPKKGRSSSSYTARMRNPQRPAKDPARASWLRKAIILRLKEASSGGIKQPLLVAGMLRRAEWADMSPDEVVSVLRELGKEERVKLSAGRWKKVGRG